MANDEDRIALLIDFENLALGARDRGGTLDLTVVMDALSERGRVVIRRAYADWNLFTEHRPALVAQRIELIEIPQRTGIVRKNAADIKLAVDAMELAFEREFITTFVIASGDSDFTPLVLKLRELNLKVIGVGVEGSTSELLPGACDEFLFYEKLTGASGPKTPRRRKRKPQDATIDDDTSGESEIAELSRLVTNTLGGLQRSGSGPVLSSLIKRVILRKDPTFNEGDYGFRTWGDLMRHLDAAGIVELRAGSADGDPLVDFPSNGGGEGDAFELLRSLVAEQGTKDGGLPLSGLKDQLRKLKPGFSEKDYGYGGFLQFVKAAAAKGLIEMDWNEDAEDYYLSTR